MCLVALPGDDWDVQDEESEIGGGGIRPGSHRRSSVLFRFGEEVVRSPDGGNLQSDRC